MRYLIISLLVLLCHCKNEKTIIDTKNLLAISQDQFENIKSLELHGKKSDISLIPTRIYAHNGMVYIIHAAFDEGLLEIRESASGIILKTIFRKGTAPAEYQSLSHMQIYQDSLLCTFDVITLIYREYNLDSITYSSQEIKPQKILKLAEPAYMTYRLNDRIIACTYDFQYPKRFNLFDLSGTYIESKVDYPISSKEVVFDPELIPQAYAVNISVSPDADKMVVCYQNEDLIQIFNDSIQLTAQITGPLNTRPAYYEEDGDLYPIPDKNRETYFSVNSNNEEIWVLYAGIFSESKDREPSPKDVHFNTILVFDWKGTLLRKYILDIPILARFAVDFKTKTIWGFNIIDETSLVKFEYTK